MRVCVVPSLLFLLLVSAFAPVAARADTPCWTMLDAAIDRRAAVTLPPYLSYDIVRTLSNRFVSGGQPLVTTQSVLLRTGDGFARVVNSLYGNQPLHTADLDPGFPFVGPTGPNRDAWFAEVDGKTIAIVHAHAGKSCDDLGVETVNGHVSEHLRVTPYDLGHPGVRDLWIGASDGEIWQAVVAQPIDMQSLFAMPGFELANCTVEVERQAGAAYVARLSYHLSDPHLWASYVFSNYRALTAAPVGAFPTQ